MCLSGMLQSNAYDSDLTTKRTKNTKAGPNRLASPLRALRGLKSLAWPLCISVKKNRPNPIPLPNQKTRNHFMIPGFKKIRRRPTLPHSCPCSTIGA